MALNTSCKATWLTKKNRWRRSGFNSGLPGNPINSIIHGSFWTRHSQSQSSLGAHSSSLTLFSGACPRRSTGLVTTILSSHNSPLSLYSASSFLQYLLKPGQGPFTLMALPKHSLSLGLGVQAGSVTISQKEKVLQMEDIKEKHSSNSVLVGNASYLQCSTTLGKGKGKTFLKWCYTEKMCPPKSPRE